MRSITERVASRGHVDVQGIYYRHAAPGRDALAGGIGGRWGARFPVIYLGHPESSIVIEAYRHLVEDAGVPAERVRPRIVYTVPVNVTRILDLTMPESWHGVGLGEWDLSSVVGNYEACQAVAAAAHQLRLHGVLAPASHGQGRTLALFRERLPVVEIPVPSSQAVWESLPADPRSSRSLRAMNENESTPDAS